MHLGTERLKNQQQPRAVPITARMRITILPGQIILSPNLKVGQSRISYLELKHATFLSHIYILSLFALVETISLKSWERPSVVACEMFTSGCRRPWLKNVEKFFQSGREWDLGTGYGKSLVSGLRNFKMADKVRPCVLYFELFRQSNLLILMK